ncbi:MAG: hypothetical protein JXR96_31115 [Deltaproteobacteria bacterium]|nr:hypothetical protein [Deltaproteobacteria bacterium]
MAPRAHSFSRCAVLLACLSFAACSAETLPPDAGTDEGPDAGALFCQSADDCPQDMVCVQGVCSEGFPCECNYDCSRERGEVCSKITGMCEPGEPPASCLDDCDCYAGEHCVQGRCLVSGQDCAEDSDCAGEEICQAGACTPRECSTREDCAGPVCLVCKNGICTEPPAVCRGDLDCCVGFHCNFGTCEPDDTGCRIDEDCTEPGFPRCLEGECVQCLIESDCASGQVCEEGYCVDQGCSPYSCPLGQWCDLQDGQCKPGCDANEDCEPPEVCNYATHTCGTTDCCGGCPGDQSCNPSTCACEDRCHSAEDCPEGYECRADGQCWCTPAACPEGEWCDPSTGQCVESCAGMCGQNAYCSNNTCTCLDGWGNCNGGWDDGCETDLAGDALNCGACGLVCNLAHATARCQGRVCQVAACDEGWCNDDYIHDNGCELALDADAGCAGCESLGSIQGDLGADVIYHTGHGDRWLHLYVDEVNSDIFCVYLSASIVLFPPDGADYDLRVYCDDCSSLAGSSSVSGSDPDLVEIAWDEDCFLGFPTGTHSGRDVYIHVVYYSAGDCYDWELEIYGNTEVLENTCSAL